MASVAKPNVQAVPRINGTITQNNARMLRKKTMTMIERMMKLMPAELTMSPWIWFICSMALR